MLSFFVAKFHNNCRSWETSLFLYLTKSIQRLALRLLRGLGWLGCGGSGGLTARGGDLLMEGNGVRAVALLDLSVVADHRIGIGALHLAQDLLRLVLDRSTAAQAGPALASMAIYLFMAGVLVVKPTGLFTGERAWSRSA